MNTQQVNELISKYNEGLADPAEVKEIEQLIEAGIISLTQLNNLAKLEEMLESKIDTSPSLRLDDTFYAMLAEEKKKQQKKVLQFPQWDGLLTKLAFAASFMLIGIVGTFLYTSQRSNPEVAQLTQEVSGLKEMMMLSLLEKESVTERLRAVSLTNEMNSVSKEVTEALVKTLNNDDNVNVRLAALDALKSYVHDSSVRMALISSIAQQDSPLVQLALAELMAALQEKNSLKEFEKILEGENTPEDVKTRIKENLKVIA